MSHRGTALVAVLIKPLLSGGGFFLFVNKTRQSHLPVPHDPLSHPQSPSLRAGSQEHPMFEPMTQVDLESLYLLYGDWMRRRIKGAEQGCHSAAAPVGAMIPFTVLGSVMRFVCTQLSLKPTVT